MQDPATRKMARLTRFKRRLTLPFSGAAAPRHYGTARITIEDLHCEPGSSRVRCNGLLGGLGEDCPAKNPGRESYTTS